MLIPCSLKIQPADKRLPGEGDRSRMGVIPNQILGRLFGYWQVRI
jgi:hypothetical protein